MQSIRHCLLLVALGVLTLLGNSIASAQTKHALLVGVTEYSNLPENKWLGAPENDVKLVEKVILKRFGFDQFPKNIVLLTQSSEPQLRPTRTNIVREFERLIEQVAPGDHVFVYMSGHGTQQPNRNSKSDKEEDGKDEVFLPSDVRKMKSGDDGIPNGILDDEIYQWTRKLDCAGAVVWLVFDSCHSGTMLRGLPTEVTKSVSPDDLDVPEDRDADPLLSAQSPEKRFADEELPTESNIVAMYASRPSEQAIETDLPKGDANAKRYSLFTFALCKALESTKTPLTYQELMSQVRNQFAQWGRNFPTPLVEGSKLNQVVFGKDSWENRSEFVVTRVAGKDVFINAGSIHGVYPEARFKIKSSNLDNDETIALVEIKESWLYRSKAKFVGMLRGDSDGVVEIGSRCVLDYLAFDPSSTSVLIDKDSFKSAQEADELSKAIQSGIALRKETLFGLSTDSMAADWVLRKNNKKLMLVPASGVPKSANDRWASQFLFDVDSDSAQKIHMAMNRIAKVRNILEIAAKTTEGWEDEVVVELGLNKRENEQDEVGKPVAPTAGGFELVDGDYVGVTITNHSLCDVEVFVFVIDSNFGISAFFPKSTTSLVGGPHQIGPKKSKIIPGKVNAKTIGKERVLMIARKLSAEPGGDLRVLAQESVSDLLKSSLRGGKKDLLEDLIAHAAFGIGKTRGGEPEQVKDFTIQTLEWTTFSKPDN